MLPDVAESVMGKPGKSIGPADGCSMRSIISRASSWGSVFARSSVLTAAHDTPAAGNQYQVQGATVRSLPPNCTTLVVNGLAYQNCGDTYYQPHRHSG